MFIGEEQNAYVLIRSLRHYQCSSMPVVEHDFHGYSQDPNQLARSGIGINDVGLYCGFPGIQPSHGRSRFDADCGAISNGQLR